jgi:hypothetical protein
MTKQKTDWKLYRDTWISTKPVLPGIWQRKEGGHFVRARVVNPATGAKEEIRKMLPNADRATAFKWLNDEKLRIKSGDVLARAEAALRRILEIAVRAEGEDEGDP